MLITELFIFFRWPFIRFSLLKFVEGTMSSCWSFFRLSVEMKWKSKQCKAFDKASGLFN